MTGLYHRHILQIHSASQVALVVENLPASAGELRDGGSVLGSGRPPGGGLATHPSSLA